MDITRIKIIFNIQSLRRRLVSPINSHEFLKKPDLKTQRCVKAITSISILILLTCLLGSA